MVQVWRRPLWKEPKNVKTGRIDRETTNSSERSRGLKQQPAIVLQLVIAHLSRPDNIVSINCDAERIKLAEIRDAKRDSWIFDCFREHDRP